MKRQLRINYKDGGRTKITNSSYRAEDIEFFRMYTEKIDPVTVENAAIYTYPLKDNVPLVIVDAGEVLEQHWFEEV